MIKLFNSNMKRFTSMGTLLDDITMSCKVEEELNKNFIATVSIILDKNEKYRKVDFEKILMCETPNGLQPFRIKDIIKTHYTIELFCRHIAFDLENDIIEDTNIVGKNGAGALEQIKRALKEEGKNFNFTSDIDVLNNSRLVRKYGMSAILGDDANSIVNRWGGEIEFDNYNVYLRKARGMNRGFKVEYRKNITGFNAKISTDSIGTKILPQGYDGLFLDDDAEKRYVYSPLLNNYDRIYVKHIQYSHIKVKTDPTDPEEEGFNTIEEARAELRACVQRDFDNGLDKPIFSADVNFVLPQDTVEGKDTVILKRVFLGDKVKVLIKHLDIEIEKQVTKYVYDSITKKYVSVSLGAGTGGFYQAIKDEVQGGLDTLPPQKDWDSKINQAIQEATDLINNGLGGFVTKTRSEILIMDKEDIATAQKLWRWNLNGLGFSKTGYKGSYTTAITSNGKFVLSEVTAEKFTGKLIQAGTMEAEALTVNGKTEIRKGLVAETTFNVLAGKVESKVDVNGVKSTLEQNPNSIKIGFNKINNNFEVTPTAVILRDSSAKKHMELAYGRMNVFNPDTSTEVGRFGVNKWNSTNNYGLHMGLKDGGFISLSKLSGSGTSYTSQLYVNCGGVTGKPQGVHQGSNLYANSWKYVNPYILWDNGNVDDDTAEIYQYHSNGLTNLVLRSGNDANDSVQFATKVGSTGRLNMEVNNQFIHAYRILDMHNWGIKNSGGVTTREVKIIDDTEFFTLNNLEKTVTTTLTKNTELLDRVNTTEGKATVLLPVGIAFTSYSVFLSVIGRNRVYLMNKNDDSFDIEVDVDCEVEYLIKFENDIKHYEIIEGEEAPAVGEPPKQPEVIEHEIEPDRLNFWELYKK